MTTPTEQLFTLALGLTSPWQCTQIQFSQDESMLEIRIDFKKGSKFVCTECKADHLPVYDTIEKTWRHLNFFQHTCYIHARVPRITCPQCGVHLVIVPWSRKGSGFTLLFEAFVMTMAENMPVAAIARYLGEHDTRIWRILQYHVSDARSRANYHDVTSIAIDETSRRRGHQYVTLVADVEGKRVLYVTKGKDRHTIDRFVDDFHDHGGESSFIRSVCMDMSPAYIEAVRECLPNATITFDRFHVMKMANEALDQVRRADTKANMYLKGSRYLWLRRPENLSEAQMANLKSLQYLNIKTSRAYQLVLNLRLFWEAPIDCAEEYLQRWYNWAVRSRLEPFRKLAKTIKRHWIGIINYHRTKMTTGFMEGINSIIQAAKRKARGYRNTDNFITIIYLIAGKLSFNLPT